MAVVQADIECEEKRSQVSPPDEADDQNLNLTFSKKTPRVTLNTDLSIRRPCSRELLKSSSFNIYSPFVKKLVISPSVLKSARRRLTELQLKNSENTSKVQSSSI